MHTGKPQPHCHAWGWQCVPCSAPYGLVADRRALLDRWLLARMALRGRGRAVGVPLPGRLGVLVPCCAALPAPLPVPPVSWTPQVRRQRLEVDAEARARVVQQKANTQWRWSAMDAKRRQGMAWHVGDRRRRRAKRLGAKMPAAYRQPAMFSPEQDVVYHGGMPAAPPRALRTLARTTTPLERCNNTLRQRGSRLGREAVSFSKRLAHHIGAMKLFICHDNLTRSAA